MTKDEAACRCSIKAVEPIIRLTRAAAASSMLNRNAQAPEQRRKKLRALTERTPTRQIDDNTPVVDPRNRSCFAGYLPGHFLSAGRASEAYPAWGSHPDGHRRRGANGAPDPRRTKRCDGVRLARQGCRRSICARDLFRVHGTTSRPIHTAAKRRTYACRACRLGDRR